MGAVTVTISNIDQLGSRKTVFGTITMSSSYATGGDTFTNGQFGLEAMDNLSVDDAGFVNATPVLVATGVVYPTTTGLTASGKILAFGAAASAAGLTQIANATDLSAYTTVYQATGW